jgi:glycerol-3-phosphate O-acyltransferase
MTARLRPSQAGPCLTVRALRPATVTILNIKDSTPWYSSRLPHNEITEAVLRREEVARYLQGSEDESPLQAQERIYSYLEELQTTQRYRIYRALQHPLYPLLRKINRQVVQIEIAQAATRQGRVIYASNHKSHTDYLIQPLVLDDNGIRPPVIAAGINLFGGALGLIHKHVTGAIPIRRETKDPAYLATLKAYIAEVLRHHDLFLYLEGGRSYSGELKRFKTGLLHAATQTQRTDVVVIPVAITYDLVIEDFLLSRQRVKRKQKPFTREVAEMIRYAVGYHSRAIVNFGEPIHLADYDPDSRRSMVLLNRRLRDDISRLYTVVPTALVAAAMRPSIRRDALEDEIDRLIVILRAGGARLDVETGREAVEAATEPLATRGIIVIEGNRYRVRERTVLRYYARTIEHLLKDRGRSTLTH